MLVSALNIQLAIVLVTLTLANCYKYQGLSDFLSDEDDEILNEIIPVKTKRNNVHRNAKRRSAAPFQQEGGASSNTKPNSQQKVKDMTSTILGDVNRYGLWEYTADNTGMGDQLKKLMNSGQGGDSGSLKASHSLEKQASKMNEQINKYVENNIDSSQPTIDPLETPEGYTPTQRPLTFKGVDSNAEVHNPSLDVVTIPNSIQIEDEHGNLLDTVKPEKTFSRSKPTAKPIISAFDPTQSVRHAVHPTAKAINQVSPTMSLTERLLKALKSSPSFRMNAQKLLASDTDTEEEVISKQQKLSAYLTAYEQNMANIDKTDTSLIGNSLSKLKENSPSSGSDKAHKGSKDDGKLLNMIKHLMKDENSMNTNQIQTLLKSLKKSDNSDTDTTNDIGDSSTDGKSSKTSKENSKHLHQTKTSKQLTDTKLLDKDSNSDSLDDISIEPQHHAKSNKKDDSAINLHHKDGILSEYTSPADDLDHPLGNDIQESPLMGYLEQESAALSNIKVDTINPDMELDKLQQMMRNRDESEEGKKEQEKIIYNQLKKLLKSPHKDNPFSPEKIKALGKEIENSDLEGAKTSNDKQGDEDTDTNLLGKDVALKKHDNSSSDLLSEFRKFLKTYHKDGAQVNADGLTNSNEENLQTSSSVHDSSLHEALVTNSISGTSSNSNSIEEQLKEIQKQKEMLKNREEKLKELSQKNFEQTNKLKIAKMNSEKIKQVDEPVDHMLELATPQMRNKSISLEDLPSIPTPGKSIYPSNDIHPELQHIVKTEPDNSVSVTSQFKDPGESSYSTGTSETTDILSAGDIQPEDIKKLKQVIGSSIKNRLFGDAPHKSKVVAVKSHNEPLSIQNKDSNKTENAENESEEKAKPKGDSDKEKLKIDSSIKAALNKAGITDKEITSKFSSTDTADDVSNMIKELSKNKTNDAKPDNETKPESGEVNGISNKTNASINLATDNSTLGNSTYSNVNKTVRKVNDDRPSLPINNPKPNADEGYTPHANFHTTFRSSPTQENSRKNSALSQHFAHPLKQVQSHIPHFSQQNLLAQYRNIAPSLKIRHFHRRVPSLTSAQNTILPPAGMGRPKIKSAYGHVTDIMEPIEPPLITYKTNANHHSNINKLQPLLKTMPTMLHAFLKHKIMPAIDEFSITGDKKSLNFENKSPVSETAVARVIKPQSAAYNNHFIDVAASKKSFGKSPSKPKAYIIKELRHKLKILTLKRHLEKQLLKKFRHRLKNLSKLDNDTSRRTNTSESEPNISKNVLIPESSATTSGTLIRQDSNVIVPGSRYNPEYNSILDENVKEKNVSENDVTRSQLPNANNLTVPSKEHAATIEEVFNIIGSEDQVRARSIIPSYKKSRISYPNKKGHEHLNNNAR